jgi:hypothetical protein
MTDVKKAVMSADREAEDESEELGAEEHKKEKKKKEEQQKTTEGKEYFSSV